MNAQKIKVNFGGSHRKNRRCIDKLAPFRDAGSLIMPTGLNSKRLETVCFDTPEMRAVLKSIGGSISRHQPSWLNKP